ncbi:MAG: Y-family DNA polymerase [Chitinophagaceae bacterium]|nr:Y-family DNA polymerase [Chitinophagaceae bacterium]
MEKIIYALIDCNNFYVSCERIFNPFLQNKPVMVLSNNDGCIVARSNEVKKLGIPMGAPAFEYKKLIKTHDIKVFSSNYELYGDLSKRVMDTLATFTNDMEIYSIDEAFLRLDNVPNRGFTSLGLNIKEKVKKWTGLPVSVGIASTKTLAKAANELAKKNKEFNGVLSFEDISNSELDSFLSRVDIKDVWGVGFKYAKKLREVGVNTALEFKKLPDNFVRKEMTVTGLRTKTELSGISCMNLETVFEPAANDRSVYPDHPGWFRFRLPALYHPVGCAAGQEHAAAGAPQALSQPG